MQNNLFICENCSNFASHFGTGPPEILIFAGEEVPRMALRVLLATHRTSEASVAR